MQIALQRVASYYIRQAFEKILADQKDRGLPLLSTDDYNPFLDAICTLLKNPVFVHDHSWQTQTLEHSISRPTFNAKSRGDCDTKLDIRLQKFEEIDSSGTVVFEGFVVSILVDGYTMAKGRSTASAGDALLDVFQKVIAMAREWDSE